MAEVVLSRQSIWHSILINLSWLNNWRDCRRIPNDVEECEKWKESLVNGEWAAPMDWNELPRSSYLFDLFDDVDQWQKYGVKIPRDSQGMLPFSTIAAFWDVGRWLCLCNRYRLCFFKFFPIWKLALFVGGAECYLIIVGSDWINELLMKLFDAIVFTLLLRRVFVTIWDVGNFSVDCNRSGAGWSSSSSFSLSLNAAGALGFRIGHVDSNQYHN